MSKKLKTVLVLTAALLLTACSNKTDTEVSPPKEGPSVSEATVNEQSDVEEESIEATAPKETEISFNGSFTEIPEDAVTKRTSVTYWNGEPNFKRIEYLNEYGDTLLRLYEVEQDEYSEDERCSYEYDGSGNIIRETIDNGITENETLYEYNSEGQAVKITTYRDGWVLCSTEYTYDEYGNTLTMRMITYYTESDEVSFDYTEDYSDCDYDENGNMTEYRYYTSSGGDLYYTVNNRFNEENELIYSEKIYAEYSEPEYDGDYMITTEYDYDDNGNKILEDEICYSSPDTISDQTTRRWEYNSDNRIVLFEGEYHNGNTEQVEYTYESL